MAEFTKLSAVEAVAAVSETANVLIEENGVIKRAPKDEIGGGIKVASTAEVGQTIVVKAVDDAGNPTEWECADMGGVEEPDLVISINTQPYNPITADIITFTEGSIDNVLSALSEKRIPIVKLKFFKELQADYSYTASELIAGVYRYGTELYFSYIFPMTYNGVVYNGYMRFTTDGVFEVHHRYSTNTTEMT